MRNKKILLSAFALSVCLFSLRAQNKVNYKFGLVSAADFKLETVKFDSGANVLIIADIGKTSFEGNDNGHFTLVFTRFMRVKIMNKNGFEIGNQEIQLYHNGEGGFEKLSSLKASTFNLENGIIQETKLEVKSIFTEKYNNNIDIKKFSLPALKEGAVFDLEYTTRSPYTYMLKPWSFQGDYPRLWSEYEMIIPPTFHYVMKMQGDENFAVNTTKVIQVTYSIRQPGNNGYSPGKTESDLYSLSGNSLNKHWVKRNVPALHKEAFTTTLANYYSRVSFQLNYFQWSNESEKQEFMSDWKATSKSLLERDDFGVAITRENSWMSDELNGVLKDAHSEDEKTYSIFNYIRDNFNTISKYGYSKNSLFTNNTLKQVFKNKEGNVAEINLLLTAMLQKAGIKADPMILSTRDHGIANAGYPLIEDYNYVICAVTIGDKIITLDASQPFNGLGQLPSYCYNGWGHIINEANPTPILFSADSVHETSLKNVFIFADEKGKLTGSCKNILGKIESNSTRREISNNSEKVFEQNIQKAYGSDIVIENVRYDSLKKYDFPLTINYDFELKNMGSADIIYFEPIMGDGYKTNPFASMDRNYPVEIPYQIDEMYTLNMDIPVGYKVDELPKSARVAYNDKEGMFEYLIQSGAENLQLRVHFKLNKAFFPVEEYNTLRDFFAFVVKKEGEKIVFQKIK